MTVVYIDDLFLLNAVVDYFLLLTAARLSGEVICRWRLALAAVFGGLYAVLVFIPVLSWLVHPLCKLSAAVIMVLISFGGAKRMLRVTLSFFVISAAFAGLIMGLQLLGGTNLIERSVLYTKLDLKLILLFAVTCYAVLTLIGNRIARHGIMREIVPATLTVLGQKIKLFALMDTGNTLTDPVSNSPVMVVDGAHLKALLPKEIDLNAPVESMERISKAGQGKYFRLISYRAVGVDCGLLLAVRSEESLVNGKKMGRMMIALSPTPVSDGGGYQGLIGSLGGAK